MEQIILGHCLQKLKDIPSNSVDAIVTDPPYGLKFMGAKWDYDVPTVDEWKECLRVLKPGGYLLSFASTRTQHRMACNIEDAGFEIRDMIMWCFGSGFPKSLDIGKSIDKQAGLVRKIIGKRTDGRYSSLGNDITSGQYINGQPGKVEIGIITEPASKDSEEWEGWGTSLKPALEPITMARKPLSEKTIAENILKWGTGGINIDECRIESEKGKGVWGSSNKTVNPDRIFVGSPDAENYRTEKHPKGRFPANLIHDGDQLVLDLFPNNSGAAAPVKRGMDGKSKGIYGDFAQKGDDGETFRNDSGSAARFFYCAKASRSERNLGCETIEPKFIRRDDGQPYGMNTSKFRPDGTERKEVPPQRNNHPTVKPLRLMQYLVKLVSKEGAVILDPYCGSGTTVLACILTNRQYIAIDKEEPYYEMTKKRAAFFKSHPELIKKLRIEFKIAS